MDSALKKFNIFDYLGIYFGGVIIVSHLLLSLPENHLHILNNFLIDIYKNIGINQNDSTLKFILVFVVFSYFVGIIFQEIGRIVFDFLGFNGDKTIGHIKKEFGKQAKKCCSSVKNKKSKLPIKRDYQLAADALCPYFRKKKLFPKFERVLSIIKYRDGKTGRLDKYHSIYAFARSMFLYFTFSVLVCIVMHILNREISTRITVLLFSDLFFTFLFYVRTKRYYISFVKNAYLQYYNILLKNRRKQR